ncbi:MAG: ABC transporter ATP-binding protein [Alicyclobacillus sp.]|nr:ABC transporter ATP-binding protein [Alicyclobacillus sp.]
MEVLIDVQDLWVQFERADGKVHAVNGATFQVKKGEWLGILGESGSGKSVSLLAMLGLLGQTGKIIKGTAKYGDIDLLHANERLLRTIRGKEIGIVSQSLADGLDPYVPIGRQIMEPMLIHKLFSRSDARLRALDLMREMGIPDAEARFTSYPLEMSGGMRQRAMLAVALACQPPILFADEPTTALDSTVQMQVLNLLMESCQSRQMTVVMVTHDLGVAANVCDRVMVMYGGQVMEIAEIDEFLKRPLHPYTLALMQSSFDPRHPDRPVKPIGGSPPVLTKYPRGCPFADRCPHAQTVCRNEMPVIQAVGDNHEVACHVVKETMVLG